MGGSTSREEQIDSQEAHIFLTKKEYEFIILEHEVEEAIDTKNREHLRRIKGEIKSLHKTMRMLQDEKRWNKSAEDRCDRLLYNYELILAKVVSSINNLLLIEKEQEQIQEDENDIIVYTDTEENPSEELNVEHHNQEIEHSEAKDTNPFRQGEVSKETVENDVKVNQELIDVPTDLSPTNEGPLHANFEFPDKNSTVNRYKSFKKIKKPPVPIPRNNQDVLVKEIPRYFSRLNDIFDQDTLTEEDVQEVYIIRRRCNEVKDIFVEKADKIFDKYDRQKEAARTEATCFDYN